jgi:hypothetical protein
MFGQAQKPAFLRLPQPGGGAKTWSAGWWPAQPIPFRFQTPEKNQPSSADMLLFEMACASRKNTGASQITNRPVRLVPFHHRQPTGTANAASSNIRLSVRKSAK